MLRENYSRLDYSLFEHRFNYLQIYKMVTKKLQSSATGI